MSARAPSEILRAVVVAALLVLAVNAGSVDAQSPEAEPTAEPSPGAGPGEAMDDAPLAAPTDEVIRVAGAANPLDAPVLQPGAAVDTILQSETLWYALDAAPGQTITASAAVVGRPDGPVGEDTFLEVTITDPQRQPLEHAGTGFGGQEDVAIELSSAEAPAIGGDPPLIRVSLLSRVGATDLEATSYRLQLTVAVDGDPLPPQDTASPVTGASSADPQVTVTSALRPPPGPPDIVGDLLPFALIALAVGGVAGFELSRRGL